jgi:D-3-phosphoglycerate dehydrogenase
MADVVSARPIHGLVPSQRVEAALIRGLPELKVISVPGTGVWDFVDMVEATAQEVAVCNVRGYAATAVSELTIGLAIQLLRRTDAAEAFLRSGGWPYDLAGTELRGLVLGVVGLGSIGSRVARLGRAFGMTVVATSARQDPIRQRRLRIRQVDLDELLGAGDVITVHASWVPGTQCLLGAEQLRRVRPSAVLINTARAGLVDTKALVEALSSGRLAGAALDVFDREPPSIDDPLLRLPNVIVTPHIGAATVRAWHASYVSCLRNLASTLHGRPRGVVNLDELSYRPVT